MRFLFFTFSFFVLLLNTAVYSNDLKLDLITVMKHAYKNNTDLKIARSKLDYAIKKADADHKKFSLKIDASISAVREDMPSYFLGKTADARSLNMMTTDINQPGINSHYETAVDFFYPIYYKGLKSITRKMSELNKNIAQHQYEAYSNEIISASISLYYNYRIALEQVKTEKISLERVKRQLREIQIKYDGGSVLRSDLLGMQVREKETSLRLITAENNKNISEAVLLHFLGLENTNIIIADNDWDLKDLPEKYEDAVIEAYAHRAELQMSDSMIQQSHEAVKMAASFKKPELLAFGKVAYNDDSFTLSRDKDSYMFGVKINYNLWDNNITKLEKAAAKEKVIEAQNYSDKIKTEIQLDVKKAFENLKSAHESLKVSSSQVEFSSENLQIMKNQYEGGTVTISAFLDAEQAYSNALLGNIAAKYKLLISKAELGRALGYCLKCVQ